MSFMSTSINPLATSDFLAHSPNGVITPMESGLYLYKGEDLTPFRVLVPRPFLFLDFFHGGRGTSLIGNTT